VPEQSNINVCMDNVSDSPVQLNCRSPRVACPPMFSSLLNCRVPRVACPPVFSALPDKPAAAPKSQCGKIGILAALLALAINAWATDCIGQNQSGHADRGETAMQSSHFQANPLSGELPKVDRLSSSGFIYTDWYSRQSCTSGRGAIAAGRYPLRAGLANGRPHPLPHSQNWSGE
jgi:hypothetical protein